MADFEDNSGSEGTDVSCSLTLPPPAQKDVVPAQTAAAGLDDDDDDDDDEISTIATDDISCSLTIPSTSTTKSESNKLLPALAKVDGITDDNSSPALKPVQPPSAMLRTSDISSPVSQTSKASRENTIKSPKTPKTPKTPKHKNVKDRVSYLPDFLATKKTADLGDSCSMLSSKTDPSGNTSKRSSAKKRSDGSLPTPKSPKTKTSKSPTGSPQRSSKTKSKVKKSASEIAGEMKKGSSMISKDVADESDFAHTLKQVGLSLPSVVVIGDTGSGKSCVVSSLCRITLPNAPTKCPVQIRMKQASEIKARVSVEWKSHIVANQYPEHEAVTTTNLDDIPEIVLAAQDFIFEHCHKQLTNDAIILEVQGPNCSDYVVIDLPGSNPEHDETLRSEIAQIRHEYLPQSVILAVHPAGFDWQSSPVIADALAVDSDGLHTVHCLTKPDLLDAKVGISTLIDSDHRELRHVHVTKAGCETDELQQFFQIEEHHDGKKLLGVDSLRERVGSLQIDLIRESLPSMKQNTIDKRESIALQLKEMGRPIISDYDRRTFYENSCKDIINAIETSLSGKGKQKERSAASRLHEDCASFRDRILEGTLATVQTVKEGSYVLVSGRHEVVRGEVVHIDMEKGYACVDYVDDYGKGSKTLFDRVDMQAPEEIDENDVWAAGNRIFIGRADNMYDALRKIPLANIRTDPSWLKQRMADDVTEDLPCFLNSESLKSIVIDCVEEDWRPHAMRLLDLVRVSVSDTIGHAIRSHIGKRHKDLLTLLAKRSETALQELLSSAHKKIQAHLEEEKHPFTQDSEFYTELAMRKHNALKQRLLAAMKLSEDQLGDFNSAKGVVEEVFAKHCHRSGNDIIADEMESILSSYGSFAARRVLDRTPQICWQVLRAVPSSLSATFEEISDKVLNNCFSGEQQFVSRQKELSDSLQRLDETLDLYQLLG